MHCLPGTAVDECSTDVGVDWRILISLAFPVQVGRLDVDSGLEGVTLLFN